MVNPNNVTSDARIIRMNFCFKKTMNMVEMNAIFCMINPKTSLLGSKKEVLQRLDRSAKTCHWDSSRRFSGFYQNVNGNFKNVRIY
jgi:hypothetical protein